jgi:hypothetical protein
VAAIDIAGSRTWYNFFFKISSAPEAEHSFYHELWLVNALRTFYGHLPPLHKRQVEALVHARPGERPDMMSMPAMHRDYHAQSCACLKCKKSEKIIKVYRYIMLVLLFFWALLVCHLITSLVMDLFTSSV